MKAKFVFMDAQIEIMKCIVSLQAFISEPKAPAAEETGIRIQTPIRPTMKMKENTFVRTDYKTGNVGPKVCSDL